MRGAGSYNAELYNRMDGASIHKISNTKSELGWNELGWIEIFNSVLDTENLGYF